MRSPYRFPVAFAAALFATLPLLGSPPAAGAQSGDIQRLFRGAEVAALLLSGQRMLKDASHLAYVEQVRQHGAAEMPECVSRAKERLERAIGEPLNLKVLNDNEFNATCYPSGEMFINTGAVQQLGSDEGAIAVVLGHEYGHYKHNHQWAHMKASLLRDGAILAAFKQNDIRAFGAYLLTSLPLLKYSRDQEAQADRAGFYYATLAGYDPDSGIRAMQLVQKASPDSNRGVEQYLSTHPPTGDRIRRMTEYATRYKDGVPLLMIDQNKKEVDVEKRIGKAPTLPLVSVDGLEALCNGPANSYPLSAHLRLSVKSSRHGYLTILATSPGGAVTTYLPHADDDSLEVSPDAAVQVPGQNWMDHDRKGRDEVSVLAFAEPGPHEFLFVLSTRPIAAALRAQTAASLDDLRHAVDAAAKAADAEVTAVASCTITVTKK